MYDFDNREKEILRFWEQEKVFEKLMKKNKAGKRWSFIDGPITANNPMGVHHAWGRTYKDLFHRFKSMQGFNTRFQNGFDCQGLWIEREEEKDLGLKDKKDIENFGILNFVRACKKRVEKFSKVQRDQSIRLGQWMDWKNSYYTMTDDNNLHNWFLIKTYHEKGWLYKGKDSVPWCPRCGTASSKHDIVTEGYKEVVHPALFMRFPLKGKKDEFFLIFTTTPWTVPANVAIAVNKNIVYAKVEQEGKHYWIAETRLEELKGKYKVIDRKKGRELKGMKYEMPYENLEPQKGSLHEVVLWDLATEEEGTGIVHIAPGCGAEDYELGKSLGLHQVSPLDEAGVYLPGFKDFSGKKYSQVNKEVLEDLEKRGFSYKVVPYKHRYPHCWRCGAELVFRLVSEWYVKAEEIRKKLISENRKVKWYPEYGKVRQEEWFKNMGDWLISRERFWGLPLPIWECKCGEVFVAGSMEELRARATDKSKVDKLPEIHRPWIDEIRIQCKKCGEEVARIPDVGDAWLDAGIVPFSTLNYLTDKAYWRKWFPADLISESMPGQARGWFNALMWASVALTGKAPFKALFGYETLKDERGEEMHKSKGNAISFDTAAEKVGADPMRLLYCLQDPSQEMRFGFHNLREPGNSLNIFYNMNNLVKKAQGKESKGKSAEDRWIMSRLNSTIEKVTEEINAMHPHLAARALQDFWLNDLSRGYIQFVRDRIGSGEKTVESMIEEVYTALTKLLAPFCPFITENVWQAMRKKGIVKEESVHLCKWPKAEKAKIDKKLEEKISNARKIIEAGLAERDNEKIGLRWPLRSIDINANFPVDKDMESIIKSQLNVKEVHAQSIKAKIAGGFDISLDKDLDPELEAEGFARELSRIVQDFRKKLGLQKHHGIELFVITDQDFGKILEPQKAFIKERTNSRKIELIVDGKMKDKERFKNKTGFSIKDKRGEIAIIVTDR